MKRSYHIAIVEPSDLLYQGLSCILYHSDEEYLISRFVSIDDMESILTNDKFDLFLINPTLIFNKEKELKRIKRQIQHLLIGCVNISVVNTYTLSLYDF